jgi:hypothetical protein
MTASPLALVLVCIPLIALAACGDSATIATASALTVTLSASPASIANGASTTLTWSSTNATSCTASGGWSGNEATSGSQGTGALTTATAYTLTCTGTGGTQSQTASVAISKAAAPAPAVTLSASPASVASGSSTTLTWSSTNATACTASGGWSGNESINGLQNTSALTEATTYTLTCTGTGGSTVQSATVTITASASNAANLMGINMFAGGAYYPLLEGFPIFKNRIRETSGFCSVAVYCNNVAGSDGWPKADFQMAVYIGIQQAWGYAPPSSPYKCGFIGTGSETIVANNHDGHSSVANIVHGTGGAYTTFDFIDTTPVGTAANYGIQVTGTTGGVKNVYCYLPAYPGSGIDFAAGSIPPSSAYTTEAINFYKQFHHLRIMWASNALYNTTLSTSTTRTTTSNTQVYNGSSPTNTANVGEGVPIEWWIGLANATGTTGLWINTPADEDGTYGAAGSWSTNMLQSVAAHYTSSGPLYFEMGNETWNTGYPVNYHSGTLNTLYTGSTGYSSIYDYLGYRFRSFSTIAQAQLPAGWWGTKAFQVIGVQFGGTLAYPQAQQVLAAMRTRYGAGSPAADLHYITMAPYVTPQLNSGDASDSAATLLSKFTTTIPLGSGSAGISLGDSEASNALAISYGMLGINSYEGGGQWNSVNGGNPNAITNLGAMILSSGMTSSMTTLYQYLIDFKFANFSHFATGVDVGGDVAGPLDELAKTWTANTGISTANSPTLAALLSFGSPSTTRNIVTPGSGSSFSGANWADNLVTSTYGNFDSQGYSPANNTTYSAVGNVMYLIKATAAGTTTLSITMSNVSGTPQTQVEVNGTIVRTVNGLVNGVNNLGSITLVKGLNYIRLGINNGAQGTAAQNQITLLTFN